MYYRRNPSGFISLDLNDYETFTTLGINQVWLDLGEQLRESGKAFTGYDLETPEAWLEKIRRTEEEIYEWENPSFEFVQEKLAEAEDLQEHSRQALEELIRGYEEETNPDIKKALEYVIASMRGRASKAEMSFEDLADMAVPRLKAQIEEMRGKVQYTRDKDLNMPRIVFFDSYKEAVSETIHNGRISMEVLGDIYLEPGDLCGYVLEIEMDYIPPETLTANRYSRSRSIVGLVPDEAIIGATPVYYTEKGQ